MGLFYMFLALAVTTEQYFTPCLQLLSKRWNLKEDAAAVTLMAVGGSTPIVAIICMGVFVAESNIGLGTVVGSAVFKILFAIGACSLYVHDGLLLMWWPFARDVVFYALDLTAMSIFYADDVVEWWEAFLLVLMYGSYFVFMRYNHDAEVSFKTFFNLPLPFEDSDDEEMAQGEECSENIPGSVAVSHIAKSELSALRVKSRSSSRKDRSGMKILINAEEIKRTNTVELLKIGKYEEESRIYSYMADMRDDDERFEPNAANLRFRSAVMTIIELRRNKQKRLEAERFKAISAEGDIDSSVSSDDNPIEESNESSDDTSMAECSEEYEQDSFERSPSARSRVSGTESVKRVATFSAPKKKSDWILYILILPITICLFLIPNPRKPGRGRWWYLTFCFSLFWIGIFTFFMVWWAEIIAEELKMGSIMMGLTLVAVGAGAPDVYNSIEATKKGMGNMAITNSFGSSIFEATIGLPFPLFLATLIFLEAYDVEGRRMVMFCIFLLAMIFVVSGIVAYYKWKLIRSMAPVMFCFYVAFMVQAILFDQLVL